MAKIELYKQLERCVVFDVKKVSELANASASYARLLIHRMKKRGLIARIERNCYTVHDDAFLIASRIVWPSYISDLAALNWYHLSEQLPTTIVVITTKGRRRKEILFGNAKIVFVRVKPKYFFGYGKVIYRDFEIFVADKEKAIVDTTLLRRMSFSEIAEIVKKNKRELDFKKMALYVLKTADFGTIKRLGFILERLGGDVKALKRLVRGRYLPLDYALQGKGKKNDRWRVIENVKL